jgi:hypothetical protein
LGGSDHRLGGSDNRLGSGTFRLRSGDLRLGSIDSKRAVGGDSRRAGSGDSRRSGGGEPRFACAERKSDKRSRSATGSFFKQPVKNAKHKKNRQLIFFSKNSW